MGCLFAMFSGRFPGLARFIVWIAKPALVGAAFTRSYPVARQAHSTDLPGCGLSLSRGRDEGASRSTAWR